MGFTFLLNMKYNCTYTYEIVSEVLLIFIGQETYSVTLKQCYILGQ